MMKSRKQFIKRFIPLLVVIAVVLVAIVVTPTIARYIRGANDVPNDFESKGSIKPFIINGELKDGELENVYFNVGTTDYPVYVRVKVIVTWKDKDGKVLYITPKGIEGSEDESESSGSEGADNTENEGNETETKPSYDYSIEFNRDDWDEVGGYWYYVGNGDNYSDGDHSTETVSLNGVVKSEGITTALVRSFVQKTKKLESPYDEYKLDVEFIVETIQAVGLTDEDNEKGEIPAYEDAWGVTRIQDKETGKWSWKTVSKSESKDDTNNGGGSDDNSGTDNNG